MTMTDPMSAKGGRTATPEGARTPPSHPLDVAGEDGFRARIAEAEAAVSAGRARPAAEVSADLRGRHGLG